MHRRPTSSTWREGPTLKFAVCSWFARAHRHLASFRELEMLYERKMAKEAEAFDDLKVAYEKALVRTSCS